MAVDLKSMLTKVLSNGGEKKFFFAYGTGKRKDGKGDGELAVRGQKPKKAEIETELAVCKELVEGVCWTMRLGRTTTKRSTSWGAARNSRPCTSAR